MSAQFGAPVLPGEVSGVAAGGSGAEGSGEGEGPGEGIAMGPGVTPESVQTLMDAMGMSRVEAILLLNEHEGDLEGVFASLFG